MNTTLIYTGAGGIILGLLIFIRQDAVGYLIGSGIGILGAVFLYFGIKGD